MKNGITSRLNKWMNERSYVVMWSIVTKWDTFLSLVNDNGFLQIKMNVTCHRPTQHTSLYWFKVILWVARKRFFNIMSTFFLAFWNIFVMLFMSVLPLNLAIVRPVQLQFFTHDMHFVSCLSCRTCTIGQIYLSYKCIYLSVILVLWKIS